LRDHVLSQEVAGQDQPVRKSAAEGQEAFEEIHDLAEIARVWLWHEAWTPAKGEKF